MSINVQALLLRRLDARLGEFVGVDALADHYGITPDLVRAELQALYNRGMVMCEMQAAPDGTARIESAIALERGAPA